MQRWQYKVVFQDLVEGFWSGLYAWVDCEGKEYGRREQAFTASFSHGKMSRRVAGQLESALEALDDAGWEFVGTMAAGYQRFAVVRRPFERTTEKRRVDAGSESETHIKASAL